MQHSRPTNWRPQHAGKAVLTLSSGPITARCTSSTHALRTGDRRDRTITLHSLETAAAFSTIPHIPRKKHKNTPIIVGKIITPPVDPSYSVNFNPTYGGYGTNLGTIIIQLS